MESFCLNVFAGCQNSLPELLFGCELPPTLILYMKTNFQTVLFTDKCRPTRLRRQQGGGGVMFWAGILGKDLVGPFRVPEGVKMTSAKYVEFLTDHFLPRYKREESCFLKQNHIQARQCTISCCKEYLSFIGCYGHKRGKKSWCGPILPWPQSY